MPTRLIGAFREVFFDDVYYDALPKPPSNSENPVIIDIGANIGMFSLMSFFRYPKAKIFAFEPHPMNFNRLSYYKEQYAEFDFQIYQQAVNNTNDPIVLYSADFNEYNTRSSNYEYDFHQEKVEVKSVMLQDVVKQHNLTTIDFMKLDCEGAEFNILYALDDEMLNKINLLSIETHRVDAPGHNTKALNEFLTSKGFNTKVEDDPDKRTGYIWAWK